MNTPSFYSRLKTNWPRWVCGLTTAAFAVIVWVFFGYRYAHHLHYQEQFQLFECTTDYALQTLASHPGGLADYLGGFVTQFFINSRLGGLLLALLLTGIHLATYRCLPGRTTLNYLLSFYPAWGMLYFLLDEHAMVSAPIALLACLLEILFVSRFRRDSLRYLSLLILIPISYVLWGSLTVVFVLGMLLDETLRGWTARSTLVFVTDLLLMAACPLVAQYIWPFPLDRLARGLHYFRYPAVFPTMVWITAGITLLFFVLVRFCQKKGLPVKDAGWIAMLSIVLCVMACTFSILKKADHEKERVMAYDFYGRYQQWNHIVALANEESPQWIPNITYLNLALGMTGHLPDYQFRYLQYSEEGLFPPFVRDFTSPLATAEAFYQLGFINTAQRYTFEAQEAIPDAQKSVRCYQRLAETALINGDYPIAHKYLTTLRHTLFYKKWADNLWQLTENEAELEKHPQYARLRKLRTSEDYLFSDTEIDAMLGRLFLSHKENRLAFEYLMSYELLSRKLDLFQQYCSLGSHLGYQKLPRAYQEALLMLWAMTHPDYNGFPYQTDPGLKERMANFIRDYRANRSIDVMRKVYGGTYWVYYIQETKEHAE